MTPLHTIMKWFRRPLSCEDVNQFIIDYLEGTIPARTRTKFEVHLAKCPNCGLYFEQYLQTVDLVRDDGALEMDLPEELVESTLHFLREHYDDL